MKSYIQYEMPNTEVLKDLILEIKGDRNIIQFADDIKRSSPEIKVSPATISRACNSTKPVSIDLLKAIARLAGADYETLLDKLAEANGMRVKSDEAEIIKQDKHREKMRQIRSQRRKAIDILQNEILQRGYQVRYLDSEVKICPSINALINSKGLFPRTYSSAFSVSGMRPYSTWKFRISPCPEDIAYDNDTLCLETQFFLERVAAIFAGDALEGELYDQEKYSFVFVNHDMYAHFLDSVKQHNIKVNGLLSAILVDLSLGKVLEETQLERLDGEYVTSIFKENIITPNQIKVEDSNPLFSLDDNI